MAPDASEHRTILIAVALALHPFTRKSLRVSAEATFEGLVNAAASLIVMIGTLWILLAVYYLTNAQMDSLS